MRHILLLTLATALTGGWAWHAVGTLTETRDAQATALATAADAPAVSAEYMMPATNPIDGAAGLEALLRDAASASAVQLSLRPLPARIEGLAMKRIEARGTEDRLRAFAEAAESPASPLRFTSWSIASDGAGGLLLKADVAAPWTHAATAEATPLPEAAPAPRAPARTLFEAGGA